MQLRRLDRLGPAGLNRMVGSEQVCRTVGGVGLIFVVDLGCRTEPLNGFLDPVRGLQRIGVGVPKPGTPRLRVLDVETAAFQHRQRGVELIEIAPGAGHHDQQFGPGARVELRNCRVIKRLQGPFRTAERSFTIGHHGYIAGIAGDPARCSQLRQRLGPFFGVISGQAGSFADGGDPRTAAAGSSGVFQGRFGIGIDQLAGGDQMCPDELSSKLAQ